MITKVIEASTGDVLAIGDDADMLRDFGTLAAVGIKRQVVEFSGVPYSGLRIVREATPAIDQMAELVLDAIAEEILNPVSIAEIQAANPGIHWVSLSTTDVIRLSELSGIPAPYGDMVDGMLAIAIEEAVKGNVSSGTRIDFPVTNPELQWTLDMLMG
jgi:hypothetical protein